MCKHSVQQTELPTVFVVVCVTSFECELTPLWVDGQLMEKRLRWISVKVQSEVDNTLCQMQVFISVLINLLWYLPVDVGVDHFYIALFSILEWTYCTLVTCDLK